MNPSAILAVLGVVLLGAYLLETLFERTRIPDQLFLIAAGLLFGHVLGWGQRSGLESADRLFTEAALLVILFHGGSTLDLRELVRSLGSAVSLTLITFLSSVALIALIAHFGFAQPWLIAALLGAMLGGTGPTVIVPMVRALKLGERVAAVLTVESGLSDVLCIVVALALLSALELGHLRVGATAAHAVFELAATIALGAVSAGLWVLVRAQLERHVRKDHLGTIAVLFGMVGAADWLGLSGPMAALVFGLVLANLQAIPGLKRLARGPATSHEEEYFVHELSFILKTYFFLYVGLIIRFDDWRALLCAAIIVALQHALRPLAVRLSLSPSTPRHDASTAAALVPKGTVAVVLARVLAQKGVPGAALLANIALTSVVLSIVSAATLVFALDRVPPDRLFGRLFAGYAADPTLAPAAPVPSGAVAALAAPAPPDEPVT